MRHLSTFILCATLLVSALAPRPAHAQWDATESMMSNNSFSSGWVNPYDNTYTHAYDWMTASTPNYASYGYFSGNRSSRAAKRAARLKKMAPRQRTEMERFIKTNGTMYKPSKSLDTAGQVAAMFAQNTGVPAAKIKPAMQELWDAYVRQAKAQSAPSTDLARTMAYCISANYYYFTGGTGVPETQVAALRAKLRDALSEDPKFRSMTGAQKQRMNESMVILTHFAALGFEVLAKKAPADKQSAVREGFKKLAGANLKGILGVAPERVGFDKDGLVIKAV